MSLEDLGLSEDQQNAVIQLIESANQKHSQELEDLKISRDKLAANNEALLGEKIKANAKAQAAEEERLQATGNLKDLEASVESRLRGEFEETTAKQNETIAKLQGSAIKTHNDALVSDISSMFDKPDKYKLTVKSMMKSEVIDGEVVTTFTDTDGNKLTTDAKAFKEWIASEQSPLSGDVIASQAAGSNGTGGGGAGNGNTNTPKTLAECDGDPELERQYFKNQRQSMS